jgi:hypothetical protein
MGNKRGAMEAPVRRSVVEAFCRAFASRDPDQIAPFIDDEAKRTSPSSGRPSAPSATARRSQLVRFRDDRVIDFRKIR